MTGLHPRQNTLGHCREISDFIKLLNKTLISFPCLHVLLFLKGRVTGTVTDRYYLYCFTPNVHNSQGLGQAQESRLSTESPIWLVRAHAPQTPPAPSQNASARSWIGAVIPMQAVFIPAVPQHPHLAHNLTLEFFKFCTFLVNTFGPQLTTGKWNRKNNHGQGELIIALMYLYAYLLQ